VSDWNTSLVKDMSCMFRGAESFTGRPGTAGWDVNACEDDSYMF